MNRDSILCVVWICGDCLQLEANGEYSPDRPADLPIPLSAIDRAAGFSLTLGMLTDEHADTCEVKITGDHDAAECDCETKTFSRSPCAACRDWCHGERHAATLWAMPIEQVTQWARESVNLARQAGTRSAAAKYLNEAATIRRGYVRRASWERTGYLVNAG